MKNAALPQAPPLEDRIVAASDEPGNDAAYEEYLRGFDDIPVLQDAVRIPPRRQLPPNFVRGERRDVRQQSRPDAYSVREATMAELVLLYREYSQPAPALVVRATPKKKRKSKANTKSKSASKKRSRA